MMLRWADGRRALRLVHVMITIVLVVAMMPLAGRSAGAVVSIERVSLVMDESMAPEDGVRIPEYSFEENPNPLNVRPASGETGYSVTIARWNSNGYSAENGEEATGTFKEGNTYWLYVSMQALDASFLPGSMMSILLNGHEIRGTVESWTDRMSLFFPVTLGEQRIWTVTFDGNGHGTVEPEFIEISGGSRILEDPSDSVTYIADDGYDFTGWYTDPSCTNKVLSLEDTPVYEDMTLYAGWKEKPELREITGIHLDGDILSWDAVQGALGYHLEYRCGEKVFTGKYVRTNQADLVHELGYFGAMGGEAAPDGTYEITITAFGEEYDETSGNGQLSFPTDAGTYDYVNPDAGDITDPDPTPQNEAYEIRFDANGGSGEMQGIRIEANVDYLFPECEFEAPEDSVFAGWTTSLDDGVVYRPDDLIKVTEDMTIYAQWTKQVNPFSDLAEGAFYYKPVLWAVAGGITTGTSETTFEPMAECSRAQIVTFLWRNAGKPEPSSPVNPFVDVGTEDYFYKAVLWAVEQGITRGTSETTFEPWTGCTRGQVVTFLNRAQGSPQPAQTECPFVDVPADAYYYQAVLWALEQKITQGMSAYTFVPDEICSRGQIVTFLYRSAHSAA